MEKLQVLAAGIAVIFVTVILVLTTYTIWNQSPSAEDFLSLTEKILSWPVAAGGLAFGGGQSIMRIYRTGA